MHCFAARLDISVGYAALSFGHPYVLEIFAPWQIYIDLHGCNRSGTRPYTRFRGWHDDWLLCSELGLGATGLCAKKCSVCEAFMHARIGCSIDSGRQRVAYDDKYWQCLQCNSFLCVVCVCLSSLGVPINLEYSAGSMDTREGIARMEFATLHAVPKHRFKLWGGRSCRPN